MICLLLLVSFPYPLSPLAACMFFVSPSKCLPWVGSFSVLSLPSSSIQGLQLTKPPFIATQRQLCTSLCLACYPVSLMFWQSADRPASSFPPNPSTPPPDSNNVSKCSSAWWWMGTLFRTTCQLSNPRLVTEEGAKSQGSDACDGWKARTPAGPSKQPVCGSVSYAKIERVHLVCLWQMQAVVSETWAFRIELQIAEYFCNFTCCRSSCNENSFSLRFSSKNLCNLVSLWAQSFYAF